MNAQGAAPLGGTRGQRQVNGSAETLRRPRRAIQRSLRDAIDAKCKDCIYDPECGGGTWREQVAQCSAIGCPLWPVRPAPSSGQFANPPRNQAEIPPGWLAKPIGEAISGHPLTERARALVSVRLEVAA